MDYTILQSYTKYLCVLHSRELELESCNRLWQIMYDREYSLVWKGKAFM